MQPLDQLLHAILLVICMIEPTASDRGCVAGVCRARKADTIMIAEGCEFWKPIAATLQPSTYRIIAKVPSAAPKPCELFAIACDKTGSARFLCADNVLVMRKQASTEGYTPAESTSPLTRVLSYVKESATKEELEQLTAAIAATAPTPS